MKRMIRSVMIGSLFLFFVSQITTGQDYYRVSGDFTVKIKKEDGTMSLTKGSVYYDKNIRQLIYRISFPEPEVWVIADTSIFKFKNDTLFERVSIPSVNEFTVFHLSLNSGMSDFGLKKSMFKVSKVEKKNDLVLSYWKIPEQAGTSIDHVVLAKKENRLESVVMVGDESKILSRQFFRDYLKIGAFEFPQQIVQIVPGIDGNQNYQVTDFSDIKVNDMINEELYRYKEISNY